MGKYYFVYDFKSIGHITIKASEKYIEEIRFGKVTHEEGEVTETFLIKKCKAQLEEYFKGQRKSFELPILLKGTEFQKEVWNALMEIPYGKRESYKWVAEKIGSPNSARAVGMANKKNPIAIIVPCHRVVGTDGRLVGYEGGLERKIFLLSLESDRRL